MISSLKECQLLAVIALNRASCEPNRSRSERCAASYGNSGCAIQGGMAYRLPGRTRPAISVLDSPTSELSRSPELSGSLVFSTYRARCTVLHAGNQPGEIKRGQRRLASHRALSLHWFEARVISANIRRWATPTGGFCLGIYLLPDRAVGAYSGWLRGGRGSTLTRKRGKRHMPGHTLLLPGCCSP